MIETAASYDRAGSGEPASIAAARGFAYGVGSVVVGIALAFTIEAIHTALIGTWIFERYSQGGTAGPWLVGSFATLVFSLLPFRRRDHSLGIALGAAAIAYLILQWFEFSAWAAFAFAIVAIVLGRRILRPTESSPAGEAITAKELAESDARSRARVGYAFSTLLYRVPLGVLTLMAVPTVYFYTAGFESTRASILAALGVGIALGGAIPVPARFGTTGRRVLGVAFIAGFAVVLFDATLRAATSETFRSALPFFEADPRLAELALCFVLFFPFALAGGWIGSIWRGFSKAGVTAAGNPDIPGGWLFVLVVGSTIPGPRDAWIPVVDAMSTRGIDFAYDRVEWQRVTDSVELGGDLSFDGTPVTVRNGRTEWLTPASPHTLDALRAIASPREAWTEFDRGLRWLGELRTVDGSESSSFGSGWSSSESLGSPDLAWWREPPAHDLCRVLLPSTLAWEDFDHVWARWLAVRTNVAGVQVMRFLDLAATPPNRVVGSLVPDAAPAFVMLVFAGASGPFVVVSDADPQPTLRERGAWLPLLTQREFAAFDWPNESRPTRHPWNPIASQATLDALIALLERDPAATERAAAARLLKALAIHRDNVTGVGGFLDLPDRHVFTESESEALVSAIEKAPQSHVVARQCRWLVELALETDSYPSMRGVLDALRRHRPDDLEVERTAARFFARARDLGATLASWERIVEADPRDIRAKIELARALFDTGAEEEARALAESVRPDRAIRTKKRNGNGSGVFGVRNVSIYAGRFGLLLLHMARNEADEAEAFEYLRDAMEIQALADPDVRAAHQKLRATYGALAPK